MPKGAGLHSAFNRSILILTPQRALKFTAVTRERHYIWLTALSFLSHSSQGLDDLAVPEPISQPEIRQHRPPSRDYESSTFRRTPARDSIRVAQGKSRPTIGPHSFSSPPRATAEFEQDTLGAMGMSFDDLVERPSEDAAEPPFIPRVTEASHTRKRSSTGPRMPVSHFSTSTNSNKSSFSFVGPSIRDSYSSKGQGPSVRDSYSSRGQGPSIRDSIRDSYSSRGSGPSTLASRRGSVSQISAARSHLAETTVPPMPMPIRNDFFDAVGTVRMEAFVDRTTERVPDPSRQKKSSKRKEPKKKDMGYWGVPESPRDPPARFRGEDPFRGF